MKVFQKRSYALITALVVLMFFMATGDSRTQTEERGIHFVSAYPGPVAITQADNSELTIMKVGDEAINYTRTTDGYTLLPDELGIYYYAEYTKDGDLIISKTKASKKDKRTKKEERFLRKTRKKLEYSPKQKKEKKDKWKKNRGNLSGAQFGPIDDAFPSTGTRKMLVILTNFSDKSFIKSNSNFDTIMNGASGSFRDFYLDNSYNQLTVNTTVVGPYNINMTMQAADNNVRDYFSRAVDAAETAGVDFSQYDNNNDGAMDALYFIHAGFGEEAGAPTYTIWSHSWSLSTYARNYDGVSINNYATSPELRGASGSSITSIGVICHEFGHNIGVPDYYDTDGSSSGGSAWDLGKWDVMAGGSWNDSGDTPAQHCMYTKWKLGWSNPTVISSGASLSLNNTMNNNEAYRINTTTSNEFFILENRQQTGWDAYLPGSGMLIYHVDGGMIDGLSGNTVNVNPSHQGLDVEEADNVRSSATYAADPFPGTGNKTSFTDTTTPSSKSWANANTGKPVTNISESSGVVSFDFMGGGSSASVTADFTFSTTGLTANFTDTSTASGTTITNWSWTFGDSTSSTSQNPSHTYASSSTYSVTLTVDDGGGNSDSITKSVTVSSGGPTYCTSSASSQQYEWIAGVLVGSLNNPSGASSYSDFTSLSASLSKGASVSVTLTPGYSGSSYTEYWAVFIDYNQDGDFTDAGETVISTSGSGAISTSFTVPTSATTGSTRMRVSMKYGGAPTSCETIAEGEVEDYTVDIQAGGSDPIAAALDYSSLSFTLTGNQDWYVTTADSYYGGSSVTVPAALGDEQSSTMETTISGKTSVSFYWKVSSEANYDYLKFYIDGVLQDEIAGTTSWAQKSYSVSSGSHTLRWVYDKDYSVSSGSDTGWVDRLQLN